MTAKAVKQPVKHWFEFFIHTIFMKKRRAFIKNSDLSLVIDSVKAYKGKYPNDILISTDLKPIIKKKCFIYIISNPAFPEWFKVGRAENVNKRLLSYNTGDPNRGYKLRFYCFCEDIDSIEKKLYRNFKFKNEWVCEVSLENLIEFINKNS